MGKRKPAKKTKPAGVVLAGPNPGVVDGNFFGSVSALLLHDANNRQAVTRYGGCIWLESSPRIHAARCEIVAGFLEDTSQWPEPPEWLLFIDADMKFGPTVVDQMLETVENNKDKDIKILGGLCFAGGRGPRAFPTLYTVQGDGGEHDPTKPLNLVRHFEYPQDELVKVNATGGAFLMIHRDVLIDMLEKTSDEEPYPWFKEYIQAGQAYGEDVFFGLRAGSLGWSTWVHTGIRIGHMKRYDLNEEVYLENQEDFIKATLEGG
jgi:GT2 family glycosyltransferase